jgi:hypothetical protein
MRRLGAGIVLIIVGLVVLVIGLSPDMTCSVISAGGGQCHVSSGKLVVQDSLSWASDLILAIGAILLILGLILLALALGKRSPTTPTVAPSPSSMPPAPIAPSPVSPTPAPSQAPPSMPANERFCPVCGQRYPADYKVCPRDGSELRLI